MPKIEETQPKYLQIAHHIRDQILRGDLRPGDEVPSERQLAADWSVSRPTAARSLEALRHQGLVEKRQGSGTYVRGQAVNRRARELYGRAKQTGKIYTPGEYAVIASAGWLEAPDYVAESLNLAAAPARCTGGGSPRTTPGRSRFPLPGSVPTWASARRSSGTPTGSRRAR